MSQSYKKECGKFYHILEITNFTTLVTIDFREVYLLQNNQDANIPQKRKPSPLPTHVCPGCRYNVCPVERMICQACIRSKPFEKLTRDKLELKIKAIPFEGPNINDVELIKSQEIKKYEYIYVVDYIFDETIARLFKKGWLAKAVDGKDNPSLWSLTLDNLQTIGANGEKYIDNFTKVSYKVAVELVYNLFQVRANGKLLIRSSTCRGTLASVTFGCSYLLPPSKALKRVHLDCYGHGYIGYNYVSRVLSIKWGHKPHEMPKRNFLKRKHQ